jgi:hypothetical protein
MLCDISSTRAGADGSHRAEPSHGQALLDELVEHRRGDRRANFLRQGDRCSPHAAGIAKFGQLDRRPPVLPHRTDAVNSDLHTVDVDFAGVTESTVIETVLKTG